MLKKFLQLARTKDFLNIQESKHSLQINKSSSHEKKQGVKIWVNGV